jgi:hypothetical protein
MGIEAGKSTEHFVANVSTGQDKAEVMPHTIYVSLPEFGIDKKRPLKQRVVRGAGIIGVGSIMLFLGVGIPVSNAANQQGDRIISEGFNPTQEDLRKARDELKAQIGEEFKVAQDKVSEEVNRKIDEKVDEFFQRLTAPTTTASPTPTTLSPEVTVPTTVAQGD